MNHGDLIKQAALLAGEEIKKHKIDEGIVQKEGRANFATAADLASEKIIIATIKQYFPTDFILSEETENKIEDLLSVDHLWVIDPIDGTNNFRYDRAYSAVSIGYVEQGEIKYGAIYDFTRNQLFFAENGKGAFLQDKKIRVSNSTDLTQSTIATDNSYDPNGTQKNLELVLKIKPIPFVLMRGSAAMTFADIASGRVDVYIHTALKPWDNAAGFLLAQEAGAIVTDTTGNSVTFLSPEVVVGNKTLVEQTIKFFTV